jgi:N-acetylneuraminic acid mutarotase
MNKVVLAIMLIFFFISGLFTSVVSPVSALDLVEDTWNTKTPMGQARYDLGVIAVDGRIYAIGGRTNTAFVSTNEQYNPVTDTWTSRNAMPTPRASFAIATYEGKIYCIGGYDNSYYDTYPRPVLSVNEVYDTVTDSWSTKTSIPVSGYYLQAHVVDGKIFILNANKDLYLYNPQTDSWTQKSSIPHPNTNVNSNSSDTITECGFSVTVNNKIMVYFEYISDVWTYRNKLMIYDPKTDEWTEGNTPSVIPSDVSNPFAPFTGMFGSTETTSGTYAPKKAYVFSTNNDILIYDPTDDTWTTTKRMPTINLQFFDVTIIDDIFYIIGGLKNTDEQTGNSLHHVYSLNMQYIPIGYNPTPVTPEHTENKPLKPTLNNTILTAITITIIIIITTALIFSLKNKKRKTVDTYE